MRIVSRSTTLGSMAEGNKKGRRVTGEGDKGIGKGIYVELNGKERERCVAGDIG